ncbi:MarR family winged helix-turn-helix transcriptional regulator [Pontibacillus litoralis]|uniref:MarR family transcripitonal regulator n=1 Tax=Pontibacillus litoralis JSM 072002 TaxID=1385512 RepID=A0A0A5G2A0_9BACI|nr:MarR family transcriptional regulator [Pontibacillus litoralis]KGX87226.1 MarR family transcripitonal regulator [Pontibacillus litoralis JSM 072002]
MKRDINHALGYHINVVSHFIHNKYNEKLAEYGLTSAQAKVMYFLGGYGEQIQSELQQRLYIKGSSMNGLVETLYKKDLIVKRVCESDRRVKLISLTDKGKALEGKLWDVLEELEVQLVDGFNKEERQVMISWLKRMKENIQSCH